MLSGTNQRGRWTAAFAGRTGRWMSTVCSALGALAIASAGLAPSAVADDVQSKQWYLDAMAAEELWTASTGEGVKVAVIDTAIDDKRLHKDLKETAENLRDASNRLRGKQKERHLGRLILIGLCTRVTAFILSGEMAFAYFIAHAGAGFLPLLNGGELAVIYCFVFLYFAFAGAGAFSIDGARKGGAA